MGISMTDREYLEYAVKKYSGSLIRAAYSITGDFGESEDIAQETFIKLHIRRPLFKDADHEKAWLLRVTINAARNRLRRMKRMGWNEECGGSVEFHSEEQQVVMEAVQSLEEKYRTVVHLHYYEGYTISGIAELLGVSASTVGTRLERAKKQLRKILEKEDLQ